MSIASAIRSVRGFRLDARTAACVFIIAAAVVIMRRPDAIVRPQFWAEDGVIWFSDAYNLGPVGSLFKTQDGYFSTYLRLTADAALALPLAAAPLFFALVALALQLAPAAVFLSSRFKDAVRSDAFRVAVVALYVAAPNIGETQLNATNAQWYLALLAFTVVVAARPPSRAWMAFDAAVLTLSGLSGPYALFLLPIVALAWLRDRDRRHLVHAAILVGCTALQAAALVVANHGTRISVIPDASGAALLLILAKQVWVGAVAGAGGGVIVSAGGAARLFCVIAVTYAAGILLADSALRAPFVLKAFLLFAAINLAASLLAPNVGVPTGDPSYPRMAWQVMLDSGSGSRYWLFPVLAFLMTLLFSAATARTRAMRTLAALFLAFLPVGLYFDFRAAPYIDEDFAGHVEVFSARPAGTEFRFPVNPKGWEMRLIRK